MDTKFKAWIIPSHRMVNVTGLCYQSEGVCIECLRIDGTDIDNKDHQEFWWKDKEAILRQFIGLKDSEGVEIYEGNILKDGTGIRQVIWDSEYARFISIPKRKEGLPMHVKIIGNIYENPELLKG